MVLKALFADLHKSLVESGYTEETAWQIIEQMFGKDKTYEN